MPPTTQPGLPSGAFIELDVRLIDEGKLIKQINQALSDAHRALMRRKEEGQIGGSCKIACDITMGYDPDMRETICITDSVTLKTPKNESVTLVKEKNGRLLCQPTGTSAETPDQMRLFDAAGRGIGSMNPLTGDVTPEKEPPAVVGSIGG